MYMNAATGQDNLYKAFVLSCLGGLLEIPAVSQKPGSEHHLRWIIIDLITPPW